MTYEDIHEHVRPHAFDRIFQQTSLRTNPLSNILFIRKAAFASGNSTRAYNTYLQWFNSRLSSRDIYRINPSRSELKFFRNINEFEAAGKAKKCSKTESGNGAEITASRHSAVGSASGFIAYYTERINMLKESAGDLTTFQDILNFMNAEEGLKELLVLCCMQDLLKISSAVSRNDGFRKDQVLTILEKVENFLLKMKIDHG